MENVLVPSALRYRNLWKMCSYPRIREAGKAIIMLFRRPVKPPYGKYARTPIIYTTEGITELSL